MMKNKGFSLVELIVVIAIMAILVGVAVPVYTSYISKAQKNKDIQMVEEVKHAMEIAAVGDKWYESLTEELQTGIGMIVIKENGTTVVASGETTAVDLKTQIEKAMKETFGEDYTTELKLSYDEWTGTLNAGGVNVIVGSAYASNPKQLLGTVQDVTDLFEVFIDADGDGVVDDGIELNVDDQYFSEMGVNSNNSQQLANGMVAYVADTALTADDMAFVNAWTGTYAKLSSQFGSVFTDVFAKKAAEYAFVEAMCTYADKAGCTTEKSLRDEFNAYNSEWEGASPVAEVYAKHCNYCTKCSDAEGVTDEAVANDAQAYLKLMKQISQSKDMISSNAGSNAMYTESPLMNYVTSYVSIADLFGANDVQDGDIALVVLLDSTGKVTVNTYPIDY